MSSAAERIGKLEFGDLNYKARSRIFSTLVTYPHALLKYKQKIPAVFMNVIKTGEISCLNIPVWIAVYNNWLAYGQSKLANCLFSHELARRCKSLGIPVTSNCMHPGVVDTQVPTFPFLFSF